MNQDLGCHGGLRAWQSAKPNKAPGGERLAIVVGVILLSLAVYEVSALPSMRVKWSFNSSGLGVDDFKWSIPMLVDLDKDGVQEVLVPAARFRMAAIRNGQLMWVYPPLDAAGTYIYKVFAADDIDGDGKIEVIYGAGDPPASVVYCLTPDGKSKWNWTDPNLKYGITMVRDLENDGRKEIVVVGNDARIYVLDSGGRLIWWKLLADKMEGKTGDPIPNAFDIDRDGETEILVLMRSDKSPGTEGFVNGRLFCLGSRGEVKWTWNSELWSCWLHNTVSIADVNDDGEYEIVLGLWRLEASTKGGIVVLNWFGRELARKYFNAYCENEAMIWDIDEDGKKEILVGSQEGFYYCLAPDLSEKWRFNLTAVIGTVKRPFNLAAALGDVTGDKKIDVVFQSRDKGTVCVLDRYGKLQVEPYSTGTESANAVAMGDADGDGKSDVVVCAGKMVYALTLDAPYDPTTFVWPMQGRDPTHRGVVAIPEVVGPVLLAFSAMWSRRQ